MRSRRAELADTLRTSYWFVPSVMAGAAIVASFLTVAIDERFFAALEEAGIGAGGVDGARGLLETAAGSMITVAGVSFSIAIVVMSLASSQFGPRLLRTFMRDRGNQVVLGVFVSTYLYCLLVLRTIRGDESGGGPFVPHLSVSISVLLTITSLAVFIYFIHHAAQLIQVSHIIASVGQDLEKVIDGVVPSSDPNRQDGRRHFATQPTDGGRQIRASSLGYVQLIDHQSLLDGAVEHDLLVRLGVRAGTHVVPGTVLAEVWPAGHVDERAADAIRAVLAMEVTFAALLASAFDEIRRSGRDILYILDRLLGTLERIAEHARRPADLEALREQVDLVRIAAQHGSQPREEQVSLDVAHRTALSTIDRRLREVSPRDP